MTTNHTQRGAAQRALDAAYLTAAVAVRRTRNEAAYEYAMNAALEAYDAEIRRIEEDEAFSDSIVADAAYHDILSGVAL